MSTHLHSFLEHSRNTPALRDQLTALRSASPEESLQSLVTLSAQAGYPVSAEEWIAAGSPQKEGALDDCELSDVSGGFSLFGFEIRLPSPQNQNHVRGDR